MNKHILQVEGLEASEILNQFEQLKSDVAAIKNGLKNFAPLELIEREQVAKMFNVTFPTLHVWVKKGLLPAHKIGNRVYFKRHEIEAALITIKPRKND